MEIAALTVTALQEKIRAKEITPLEALSALEERIAATDGKIHGYLSRNLEAARRSAESADVTLPLGGVPIAIKDVINV
ncbi:MAG TPA: Asp-tRNA(Asn)/Glu-tRNA(Gln) amidotransferase GatCAB subunit A, partial [Chthoniobacteraceae bacterium]